MLLYVGLAPREAFLSLNDPANFASQLAAAVLAGAAWGSMKFSQTRSRVVRIASFVLLGFSLGYNLAFGIRSGFALALVALLVGGSIGVLLIWLSLKILGSQLQVLGLVRRHVRPLLGAIVLYVTVVFVYGAVYYLLAKNDAHAFSCQTCDAAIPSRTEFFYFSVMTMTTLGYGEIEPVSGFAWFLTVSEVIIGAVIFVAYIGFVLANATYAPKKDTG